MVQTKRKIDRLIVHCSATPEGRNDTVADIRRMHVQVNGWKDVGYHYIIHLDGTIHKGRDESVVGAHTKSYNANSIGVCYIGGVDKQMKPKDTRTPEQKKALLKILRELKYRYPDATIHGHREFANKACPSFDAKSEYSDLAGKPSKEDRPKSLWERLRDWLNGGEKGATA